MTMPTITEQLQPLIDDALKRLAPLDGITGWDYSATLVPNGQGGMMALAMITLRMKSPLLGEPDIANVDTRPINVLLTTQPAIDAMVTASLTSLRQVRTNVIASRNGNS